jgi:hypothetical protein
MDEKDLLAVLRKIRDEARKNRPSADKIFALASGAIERHRSESSTEKK